MKAKKIGLLAAAVIVVAGGAAYGLRRDPVVSVTALEVGDVVEAIYSTGVVASERSATLRASVTGNVRALPLKAGDPVKAGQVLIALDSKGQALSIAEAEANAKQARASVAQARSNLQQLQRGARSEEIDQARASLQQATADLKGSELELARNERLLKSSAATQAQVEGLQQRVAADRARVKVAEAQLAVLERGSRREQIEAAEAQLAVAEAQLAQREVQLSRSRQGLSDFDLVSPFAGLISGYLVQEGDSVSPGTALATVVDPGAFVIKTAIDEVDILKIKLGQEALVALDAKPEETHPGKVERVIPKTDPVAKTAEVIVRLEKLPEGLLEGMTATVNLVTDRRRALTAPAVSVIREGEATYLWRVKSDKTLERAAFDSGIQDGNRIEVKGLKVQDGELFVKSTAKGLREGRRIRFEASTSEAPGAETPSVGAQNAGAKAR
ncbi:Macrolide export protein MacA [compost metagenome]